MRRHTSTPAALAAKVAASEKNLKKSGKETAGKAVTPAKKTGGGSHG